MTEHFLRYRITMLQDKLKKNYIDAALLTYSRDIYYFTGTAQPSYLIIFQDDYRLFVKSGYDFAKNEIFIEKDKILKERKLERIYSEFFMNSEGSIAIAMDMTSINDFNYMVSIFKDYNFIDISPVILELRKIKDTFEIDKIKKACNAIDKGHDIAIKTLRPGITEIELSASIEKAHRTSGHDGTFFIRKPDFFMGRGPLASGANLYKLSGLVYSLTGRGLSSSVPVGASEKRIENGDLVIVDIPTCVDGYHADMTRTYALGKIKNETLLLYEKLSDIHKTTLKSIRPGSLCREIYKTAIKRSIELGTENEFLKLGDKRSSMIGHGVGIEMNEPPFIFKNSNDTIPENSVIALEMHMFSEEHGVMKIEDTILIGKGKNEILTKSPDKIAEL